MRRILRSLWRLLLILLLLVLVLPPLMVLPLRWVEPLASSFMLQHATAAWWQERERPWVVYEWVDLEQMSESLPLAAVAAEDQRFPSHGGLDWVELERAWDTWRAGGRLRGASTITQQTAKNLFLWPGRDPVRKGLEAWFAWLMERMLGKRRILELYLNIAQFGPDTFGVSAASWRFFSRPPIAMGPREAALLVSALPNPHIFRLNRPPGPRQRAKQVWVQRQMRRLGGASYLEGVVD